MKYIEFYLQTKKLIYIYGWLIAYISCMGATFVAVKTGHLLMTIYSRWLLGVCSIRIFAKRNMVDPSTIMVHDVYTMYYTFSSCCVSFQVSPARSRDGNEECVLLDFFNSHDVWHFLSAFALFFSFLVSVCVCVKLLEYCSEGNCGQPLYTGHLRSQINSTMVSVLKYILCVNHHCIAGKPYYFELPC